MSWFKETNWAPKRTQRPVDAKAGSPTGGNTYGDGTPIVGRAAILQHKRRGNPRRRV